MAGAGQYVPAYDDTHDRIASDTEFFQIISIDERQLLYECYDATGDLYDAFKIDCKRNRKKLRDLTPASVQERTALPDDRREKYSEAEWSHLDSLRIRYNKLKGIQ